jgi:hypothetical protein
MIFRGKQGAHGTILSVLLLLLLGSCGGAPGKSAGGTGLGPVSGFSTGAGSESVIVNGVKYNVDNTIFVDAHGRTLDNLAVGMVVKVTASSIDDNPTSPNGVATKMEVVRLADGPMDDNSVSIDNNSYRVMGQTVFVGLTTVFDNVADLFAIDNIVRQGKRPEIEIHGSTDDTGFLRASFVHLWSDNLVSGRGVQIKGTVAGLNKTDNTFTIGPRLQKVDYSPVPSVPAGLDNGVFVEVKGTYRSSDNTIRAESIKLEDPASGQSAGDLAKAEGYVNRVLADLGTTKRFELISPDGLQIANWSTVTTAFRDGAASDVAPGAKVQVEGSRNQDNTVAAKRISLRKPCNIRIESTVTAKFSSSILVRVLGLTPVEVNLLTSYKDGTGTFPGAFGLGNISIDNTVLVDAFLDNSTLSTRIVATRVELRGPIQFDRHILQGVVEGKNVPALTFLQILGIDVETVPESTEFLQVDGTPFPGTGIEQQVNFFNAVTVGVTVVKARGSYFASKLDANEVRIQPVSEK